AHPEAEPHQPRRPPPVDDREARDPLHLGEVVYRRTGREDNNRSDAVHGRAFRGERRPADAREIDRARRKAPAPERGLRGAGLHGRSARAPRGCLQGTRALPSWLRRLQRALPTTHAVHGPWPMGDVGSMAAMRTLTFAFEGRPSSTSFGLVQGIDPEIVAGFDGSVAC